MPNEGPGASRSLDQTGKASQPEAAMGSSLALSVIVATVDAHRTIARCLDSISRATAGFDAEIIVVDASHDDSATRAEAALGSASVTRMARGSLTPQLWAAGIARARGRVVALTIGQCIMPDGWARALLSGIASGHAGVSGALDLDQATGPVDWAVFYLRYAEFLADRDRARAGAAMIPADNAAYDGAGLRRHAATFVDGFWEVDYHRRLFAEGRTLAFVPNAVARFGRSSPLGVMIRHRFRHGATFGAWRAATGAKPVWKIIAAAPLVPALFALRTGRRVLRAPGHTSRFVLALPFVVALAAAWALGEAWGAARGGATATTGVHQARAS
jgi:glycosyltransferase involved in cell wall biosynthesis